MNLLLHNVVSDITGMTGMRNIKAILAGERDSLVLAGFRHPRCKNSMENIARSLEGHYKPEHLFSLKQAVELYEFSQAKIADCDRQIEEQLGVFDDQTDGQQTTLSAKGKVGGNAPEFDVRGDLYRMTGFDLTRIEGIDAYTTLKVVSEVGMGMSRWKSSKQFASWIGLCPGKKVSGGKRLGGKTKFVANRAAIALRIAADSLYRSKSALDAYLRRQKARLGAPKVITAIAHKLARLIYSMLKQAT